MDEDIIQNWLALSEYDLQTAKSMFQSERYMYVAFTCQQAVEKQIKALYVKELRQSPPYIHNLLKLAQSLPFFQELSEGQIKDLELLNSYYLQSRYSDQLQEIMAQFTKEKALMLLQKAEELIQWFKARL